MRLSWTEASSIPGHTSEFAYGSRNGYARCSCGWSNRYEPTQSAKRGASMHVGTLHRYRALREGSAVEYVEQKPESPETAVPRFGGEVVRQYSGFPGKNDLELDMASATIALFENSGLSPDAISRILYYVHDRLTGVSLEDILGET